MNKLKEVTRSNPCPVCRGDHKCTRRDDGRLILCGRETGQVGGFKCAGAAKNPIWTKYWVDDGRDDYRRDHHVSSNGKAAPPIDWIKRFEELKANLTPELTQELAGDLELPLSSLSAVEIGFDPDDMHGRCWVMPVHDGRGNLVGLNRRYPGGKKMLMPDSKGGLTLPAGWKDSTLPLLLVEGFSDVVACFAMGQPAVGRPSNVGGVDYLVDLLRDVPTDRTIIVLGERDRNTVKGIWPGRDGAKSTAEQLQERTGRKMLWSLPPDGFKDVRKWLIGNLSDSVESLDELGRLFLREVERLNRDAGDDLTIYSLGDLVDRFPQLRNPVIDGLLREGETANIIATSKVGKSWLSYGLAVSVATARKWLQTYQTYGGNVLLIDNELHRETIASRIPRVCSAMGVPIADVSDKIKVIPLRGRLRDLRKLSDDLDAIEPGQFKLIIVDAFYRTLPEGTDENSNADMAALYNLIDKLADRIGAAFVMIHHASKGSQSDKQVTDVGSGAGSMSRAADTHIVLRPHEQDGAVVMEAAVRSWPPVSPVCLKWYYPCWVPDPMLDPTLLRKPAPRRQSAADEPAKMTPEQKQSARDADDDLRLLDAVDELADADGIAPFTRARELARIDSARMTRSVARLVKGTVLEQTDLVITAGKGAKRTVAGLRRKARIIGKQAVFQQNAVSPLFPDDPGAGSSGFKGNPDDPPIIGKIGTPDDPDDPRSSGVSAALKGGGRNSPDDRPDSSSGETPDDANTWVVN